MKKVQKTVTKRQAIKWMDRLVDMMENRTLAEGIDMAGAHFKEIHISGLIKLAEIIGFPWVRVIWDGNVQCGTNHDEVYFEYRGYKFFQLVDHGERN